MYKGLIPTHEDGSLITYSTTPSPAKPSVEARSGFLPVVWIENKEFDDILELKDYSRGRSSVTFNWRSVNTGAKYETSLATEFAMIPGLKDLKYQGRFVFVKRGKNYLLEILELA